MTEPASVALDAKDSPAMGVDEARTRVVDLSISSKDRMIMEDTRLLGQPMPLLYIFSLEFWERFSFYGLQAILAIYIYFSVADGGLGLGTGTAVGIIAAYGGTVYLSTLLGAWVSDRLFGAERTIFYSAVIVVIGHVTLALVPGLAGLLVALVLTAVGAGGVKANAAAMVGQLYSPGSQRKDGGFVLYYMSITIGALFGPLLTGLAQSELGFHYGFGLAAIGMTIGLVIYSLTKKHLPDSAKLVPNPLPVNQRWMILVAAAAVVGAFTIIVSTGLLNMGNVSQWVSGISLAMLIMFYYVFVTSKKVNRAERKRTIAFIPALVSTVVYFALHFQVFGLLTTYADTSMNRKIGDWEMPVAWLVTMYAVLITVAAPFLSRLWTRLRNKQPSSSMKLGLGLPITGVAFLMFIPFANATEPNSTPVLWVALILFLIGIGELLVGPVGVSLATTVAPAAFKAQTVGVYYLSIALGSALSGVLGQFYDPMNQVPYWITMGALGLIAGAVQIIIARPVSRVLVPTV
ncbi:POT family proton-dependent oligopeptide transporter [Leucobacter exalbidus]|uniref:POT family proton-dependent oligopeptide transporter n=1 Tax=Leucobacter exalbidus TaxID=662960 RepID=A0A940T432_9MICO|nr:oligopeptide:H+ symporter [Leucobacter exalbidus]MBP1326448.1 POT family proton-dependent oligopeptide transporter [Leucobacter exalbidus]